MCKKLFVVIFAQAERVCDVFDVCKGSVWHDSKTVFAFWNTLQRKSRRQCDQGRYTKRAGYGSVVVSMMTRR